jgi:putative membrane protein
MSKRFFSKEGLNRIQKVVKDAESASAGEIVPVFARHSSFYEMALWRGGFVIALLVSIVLLTVDATTDALLFYPPYLWIVIVFTSGIIGGAMVMQFPALKRWIIGKKNLKARVEDQAQNMFYQYHISFTEQRSGILLYISFFEKMAVILPDVGIAEVIPEEEWEKVIHNLTDQIAKGNILEGITSAIYECGQLLEKSNLQVADDDRNELTDEIRFKE